MNKAVLTVLFTVSCVAWVEVATTPSSSSAQARPAATPRHVATFVETHCVACHNDRALTGGLSLSAETFASLGGEDGNLGKGPSQDSHGSNAAGEPAAAERR